MFCQSLSKKHISTMVLVLLSMVACSHIPLRVDESGVPQREFTYQTPLQIDDGWNVASLADEGVNKEIINDMMTAILAGKYTSDDAMGYGYYWWLSKYKGRDKTFKTIFAAGHGGQRVMVVPELDLVAVFTSKPDDNPKGHQRIIKIMEKYILPSMSTPKDK